MPLLATLLAGLFGNIAAFLSLYFTRKVAVTIASAAALSLIFSAIILVMRNVVTSLLAALSASGAFALGLGIAIPPHGALCLASIATTWTGVVLYKWQKATLGAALAA